MKTKFIELASLVISPIIVVLLLIVGSIGLVIYYLFSFLYYYVLWLTILFSLVFSKESVNERG